MSEAAFLILLFLGIMFLLGGLLQARLYWRADVAPYGRQTNSLDVAIHPERYAAPQAARAIRVLSVAGAVCLAGALGVLMAEAFAASSGPTPAGGVQEQR